MEDRIGEYYRRHHSGANSRYGFTISGDERGGWFREAVREASRAARTPSLEILDIGCRDGTLTQSYAHEHRVRGLDVDPEAVARARASGLEVDTINLNQAPLPFEAASFDVVVAGEILEHLQFPDEVVREVHRVLRPGGRFLGSVPNAFRLRNRLLFLLGRDFEVDPTHLHWFSPTSLRGLLGQFSEVALEFHGGRRRGLSPQLMATQMHWIAVK